MTGIRAALTAALLLLPLACGAAFFFVTAPTSLPGVYACVNDCNPARRFRVPMIAVDATDAAPAVADAAAIVPTQFGTISSFLVVAGGPADTEAPVAIQAFIVNGGTGGWNGGVIDVPASVRHVNPRIRRIDIDQQTLQSAIAGQYEEAVGSSSVSRSRLDVMLGIRVGGGDSARMYALRVGPA